MGATFVVAPGPGGGAAAGEAPGGARLLFRHYDAHPADHAPMPAIFDALRRHGDRRVSAPARPPLPEGLVAFVKRDCPTCTLVAPVLADLAKRSELTVYSQDDPSFPPGLVPVDDRSLEMSWHHAIDSVPTLIRVRDGVEAGARPRLAPRGMAGADGRRRARGRASRLASRLRLAERRSGSRARSRGSLRRVAGCALAASSWRRSRTSSRRSSNAAGATACRWCRRPRSGCSRCSAARSARRTRSWRRFRPIWSRAASRRWRSTR